MPRSVYEVEKIMFVFEILQEQRDRCSFYRQLFLLFIYPRIKPFVVFLQIPIRPTKMSVLDKHIHKQTFSVMQMSSNTNVSDTSVSLSHQICEILSLIISLEWLLIVITFLMFSRYQRSLQCLSILLLIHDFCSRVHFFMRLVKLFIFVQDYSVFI